MSQVVDNKVVATPPCIAAVNIAAVGADFTLTGLPKLLSLLIKELIKLPIGASLPIVRSLKNGIS